MNGAAAVPDRNDQHAEHDQHDQDGQEPPFLAVPEEIEELRDDPGLPLSILVCVFEFAMGRHPGLGLPESTRRVRPGRRLGLQYDAAIGPVADAARRVRINRNTTAIGVNRP